MLQRQPGGPCSWATRRASHPPTIKNATKPLCPIIHGAEGRSHKRGSSVSRHCRPPTRWMRVSGRSGCLLYTSNGRAGACPVALAAKGDIAPRSRRVRAGDLRGPSGGGFPPVKARGFMSELKQWMDDEARGLAHSLAQINLNEMDARSIEMCIRDSSAHLRGAHSAVAAQVCAAIGEEETLND